MKNKYFLDNKYYSLYTKIINKYENIKIDGYAENHHIIPRSLGGPNDKSNIIRVPPRVHYICHRLLTKFTVDSHWHKMMFAYNCFIYGFGNSHKSRKDTIKITSHAYDNAKKQFSEYMKVYTYFKNPDRIEWWEGKTIEEIEKINKSKGRSGALNSFFGKKHTQESKEKSVKNRRNNHNGEYHPSGCPFSDANNIQKIKDTNLNKTLMGCVDKYNTTYDIVYNDKRYCSVSSLSKDTNIKEKIIRRFISDNNTITITTSDIETMIHLNNLEIDYKKINNLKNIQKRDKILIKNKIFCLCTKILIDEKNLCQD